MKGQNDGAARLGRGLLRLGGYVATIACLLSLNFLLPRLMPGDPIDSLLAQSSANFTLGEESRAALEEYYGVDKPMKEQFVQYVRDLAHGDLGRSVATNATVTSEIARRLPWTLLLIGTSLTLSTLIGVAAGVHSGWRRGRAMDKGLLSGLLVAREFPSFLLGSLLLLLFAVKLDWLPLFGAETPFLTSAGLVERAVDIGRHLLLPAAVLTIGLTAGTFLVMRAGMVGELGSDHLLVGRAKGLRERRLKYGYAARNALLPVVSLTGLQLGFVLTGNVLIERIFAYPGLGQLIFESIPSRDYPAVQGTFLLLSISVVTVNALADVLSRRLDPRIAS